MVAIIHPVKLLQSVFPVLNWSRKYDPSIAISDAIAGFTVALTLIPQSIAYASLAGLDAQYGLYSSLAGGIIYLLLGTCPEINIGPTALLSLLTFTYTHGTNPDFAVLLCFLGGIVQLTAAITRLGFLVDFVSTPVVSGFTSASALIIACSQLKGLLGLSFKAEKFIEIWEKTCEHISEVRMADALLSLACCIVLLLMRQMKDIKFNPKNNKEENAKFKFFEKVVWFISVGRNATVVILCTVIAYLFQSKEGENPFILTGEIRKGLPKVDWPPFSSSTGNQTYNFGEMVQHIGAGVAVVPLVGIIANVAIAKAFVKGTRLDATQEMLALGVCNVVGSMFGSYPANGSFSRSAVSNASGVRTPAAGLYTSLIVLLTLSFLTPYFYFIPKSALASVIVCAVLVMIDVKIVKDIWISKSRLDLAPLFSTFLACLLLDVAYGILVGIAIDLIIILFYSARPKIRVETVAMPHGAYAVVTPTGGLFFPASNHIRDMIGKEVIERRDKLITVVIDCHDLYMADWTTVQSIKSLAKDFKENNIHTMFLNLKPNLRNKIQAQLGSDIQFVVKDDNIYLQQKLFGGESSDEAVNNQEIKLRIPYRLSAFESNTHL